MSRPAPLQSTAHYRNAMRFRAQPRWFDFYNCRVILPEQNRFFFVMPYILSGSEVPDEERGLYLYDGGNGGPQGSSQVTQQRITGSWSADTSHCDLRWTGSTAETTEQFSETRIQLTGPTSTWDVRIEPFLTDRSDPESSLKRFDFEERMILNRVPFIHRVPKMKGFATGVIEQQGIRYGFERAVVYQAKNHGRGFPDEWVWVHANTFDEPNLAIEVASLNGPQGPAGMARISNCEGVTVMASWMGDHVQATFDGKDYTLEVKSRDGTATMTGRARHGESVRFDFNAPDGSRFENDECLVGELELDLCGRPYRTHFAALGFARRTVD